MNKPKIFVSFDFEKDRQYKYTLNMWNANSAFEFTCSIDELGQIVLTPLSKETEFTTAELIDKTKFDSPIEYTQTNTFTEESSIIKEFFVELSASMLAETDNKDVTVDIDDIGQVVILPVDVANSFVSATIQDSLNLITEDLEVIDYFGYKLINNGDGWDIKDYLNEVVEEGVATEAEAKVVVLTTELQRLQSLTEDIDNEEEPEEKETSNNESEVTPVELKPDVTAQVVIESLTSVTKNFTDKYGAVTCDVTEKDVCCETLRKSYNNVTCKDDGNNCIVSYINMNEDLNTQQRSEIINRFLQGEIAVFNDNGSPRISFVHLNELDSDGYEYYYDEDSDSIMMVRG